MGTFPRRREFRFTVVNVSLRTAGPTLLALVVVAATACDSPTNGAAATTDCSIPASLIFDGGPGKDGIPALTNPLLVGPGDAGASYLREQDRVIGIVSGEVAIAVPLNIGWWHEIVNFDLPEGQFAVTHCPLTGSSLAFDRANAGGATFGVSGLLFQNNLIMYDRNSGESLWPQMLRGARCGPRDGVSLAMYPVVETTWLAWRDLHPDTRVVSSATGHSRNYQSYPYGDYARLDNGALLFPIGQLDPTRPPKERVLGIPREGGGVAFPFGLLAQRGAVAAEAVEIAGGPVVVLWDSAAAAAMAYRPFAGGQLLTFTVADGVIRDAETNSAWRFDGVATSGPLSGQRLEAVAEAFVSYWFAWAAFHPSARIWTDP